MEELGVFCWSSGFAFPSLSSSISSLNASLVRIGSRGNCQSKVSDVSSLELYLFNNVNTNPV